MKNSADKKVIYSINIADVQTVAEGNFGRKLTSEEIEKIIGAIGNRIPWYEAIQDAIKDKLGLEELEYDEKFK